MGKCKKGIPWVLATCGGMVVNLNEVSAIWIEEDAGGPEIWCSAGEMEALLGSYESIEAAEMAFRKLRGWMDPAYQMPDPKHLEGIISMARDGRREGGEEGGEEGEDES